VTSARVASDSPPKRDRDPVRCPETPRRKQVSAIAFLSLNHNTPPLHHEIHLQSTSRNLKLLLSKYTRRHGLLRHLVSATPSSKGLPSAVRVEFANGKPVASSIWRWACLWFLEESGSSLMGSQCMHLSLKSRMRAVEADLSTTQTTHYRWRVHDHIRPLYV
jgi:hypothetical protein